MADRTLPGGHEVEQASGNPVWCGDIPFRNPYFIGRATELAAIEAWFRDDPSNGTAPPVLPIHGLGGVGKTEIAAEYAHRHRSDYSLVWWIRAEREETVVDALVTLSRRLGLTNERADDRDYAALVAFDALQAGHSGRPWLLVYDNVTDPEMVRRWVPAGPGHVIVTSRKSGWRQTFRLRADGLELGPFTPDESLQLLSRRTDGRVCDTARPSALATRLITALGNLPLALDHCAAFLNTTHAEVGDYLERFTTNAFEMLAEPLDIYYEHTVSATWAVSRERMTSDAVELFQLLAFFGPEPVSVKLLADPHSPDATGDLGRLLGDRDRIRDAIRELVRFSLVKTDVVRNVVEVHRVVQAVTRGRVSKESPEQAAAYQAMVYKLLAASDPKAPELPGNDALYQLSLPHLQPSGACESADPGVAELIINQVRRLHRRGGYQEALGLGEPTLETWRGIFGPDQRVTLRLAIEIATTLRDSGQEGRAHDLNIDTLGKLTERFGVEDEYRLICAANHGEDLRRLAKFEDALRVDRELEPLHERRFGQGHPWYRAIHNNIAIDLRCAGKYREALQYDRDNLREFTRISPPGDLRTLRAQFGVARDLRRLGHYEESLDLLREIIEIFDQRNEPWHTLRLIVHNDFCVALRRAGFHEQAREQGEEGLSRHIATIGPDAAFTLMMAGNLVNDRRLTGDLGGARQLAEDTLKRWETINNNHPNAWATRTNLSVVLQAAGFPLDARDLAAQSVEYFERLFGPGHPHTLVASHDLAMHLATLGRFDEAYARDMANLELSRCTYDEDHPVTLAIKANLVLDQRAAGGPSTERLEQETRAGYLSRFHENHPLVQRFLQQARIALDIEPMSS